MPLKHATETRLIALLGLAILVTGFLMATLPDFPAGFVPWGILFTVSIAYPVLLYPLLKRDRADYTFRLLHWVPAAMLAIWCCLQGLTHLTDIPLSFFDWGWGILPVVAGVFGLIAFALHVIRQRTKRLRTLLLLFVPFVVFGFMSEREYHYEDTVASVLWQSFVDQDASDMPKQVAQQSSSSTSIANLDPSEDPAEEQWRERLREMEERKSVAAVSSSSSVSSQKKTEGSAASLRDVQSNPMKLPDSGFPVGVIAVGMVGAYCALLHQRMRIHS